MKHSADAQESSLADDGKIVNLGPVFFHSRHVSELLYLKKNALPIKIKNDAIFNYQIVI